MTSAPQARRRFLKVSASFAACLAAGGSLSREAAVFEWRGTALGADARLSIAGRTAAEAKRLVALTLGEIERLERAFSLYRSESELVRLNAEGRLEAPSLDFRILLSRALGYWQGTGGSFNPALQPLWRFLAAHFGENPQAGDPDPKTLAGLTALADPGRVEVSPGSVRLAPGMALSFNGIAQGYITDRVSELLANEGCGGVLVQLGEVRALPGKPWRVDLAPAGLRLDLQDAALATSEPLGTRFTADGRWNHLLEPESGRSSHRVVSASVKAASATEADALSTALAVAGARERLGIAARYGHAGMLVTGTDGRIEALGRPVLT
jgi:thiamine biosynthesis lipoprotein